MKAYGSEPVLLPASPVTAALTAAGRRRKQRVWWWLAAAGCGVLVLLGAVWWQTRDRHLLPADIRQTAGYPLYVPGWLPTGTQLDRGSVDATSQVVTFAFTYAGNKKLVFTEQSKPGDLDFESFYDEQLTEKQTVGTPLGQATLGLFEDAPFASVIADRTWILLRAPQNMNTDQFTQVIRSLHQD